MNVKIQIKNYAVCKQFFSNGNYFLPFITANISFPLSSFHIKILIILYSFCGTHILPMYFLLVQNKSAQLSFLKGQTPFSYHTSFST